MTHHLREFVAALPNQVRREKRNEKSVRIVGIGVPLNHQVYQYWSVESEDCGHQQPAAPSKLLNLRAERERLRASPSAFYGGALQRDPHSGSGRIRGFESHFNDLLR